MAWAKFYPQDDGVGWYTNTNSDAFNTFFEEHGPHNKMDNYGSFYDLMDEEDDRVELYDFVNRKIIMKEVDELPTNSSKSEADVNTSEAVALIQKQEREEVEEIIVAYEKQNEIFRWLLGYEDFPERKAGEGAYWWRKPLREKLNKIRKLSTSSED